MIAKSVNFGLFDTGHIQAIIFLARRSICTDWELSLYAQHKYKTELPSND